MRRATVPASAVSVEFEVPFHDVDSLRVVWHGHYLKYLEIGRTALLRSLRLDAADLFPLGFYFLVAETHVRHQSPLRYADRLRVACWVEEWENRVRVEYVITNLTAQQVSARASTTLVTMHETRGLCLETPLPLAERLRG